MRKAIFILAAVAAISCNSKTEKSNADGSDAIENNPSATAENSADDVDQAGSVLVAHPMIDNKKQVMGQMTFPANWRLHNEPGKAAFTGPNGIFVYYIPLRNFMYTNDPMTSRAYIQNGGKLRAPMFGKDIVNQDLLPIAQKEGSKLIRVYDAPAIAKSDASVSDMMYRIGPPTQRNQAVISEWEDKNGNPYAMIIHVTLNDMGNMMMWSYYGHGLDAPKEKYESAKNTLVNGLASLQYNPRYFDKYNQNEQYKEGASWAAHNQKMSSQQRQFDAQQSAFKQRSEATNKSIMDNYDRQNAVSDRNHNRFVNYIKGENTVTNTSDGKRYQVETGSGQYWVNDDGQYIGSNDPNYDPNRNPNTNDGNWNDTQIDE